MKNIISLTGNTIANSAIGQGITNLITDITGYLLVIIPAVFVLLFAYFQIRKGAADDDMDKKIWDKKIKSLIICCVLAECASACVNLIMGYFPG